MLQVLLKIPILFQDKTNSVSVTKTGFKLITEVSVGLKNTGEVSDGRERLKRGESTFNRKMKESGSKLKQQPPQQRLGLRPID